MSYELRGAGFSMPFGASLYPPPPYEFRNAEQVTVSFTTDADAVADSPAQCEVKVCNYRWSTFGPFHETYVLVRVRDSRGTLYWYLPLILTDSEVPLAAGRELWGYPKKLATMRWIWGGASEQLHFSVSRPAAVPLFSVTFAPERLADPAERQGLPVVSHRLLPPSQAGRPPAADELIAVAYPKTLQSDATGAPKFWAGRGSLSMGDHSDLDPWYRFTPIAVTAAFWQVSDFALPAGTLVRDFLVDPA